AAVGGWSCIPLGGSFGRPDARDMQASIDDGSAASQASPGCGEFLRCKRIIRKLLRKHNASQASGSHVHAASRIFISHTYLRKFNGFMSIFDLPRTHAWHTR